MPVFLRKCKDFFFPLFTNCSVFHLEVDITEDGASASSLEYFFLRHLFQLKSQICQKEKKCQKKSPHSRSILLLCIGLGPPISMGASAAPPHRDTVGAQTHSGTPKSPQPVLLNNTRVAQRTLLLTRWVLLPIFLTIDQQVELQIMRGSNPRSQSSIYSQKDNTNTLMTSDCRDIRMYRRCLGTLSG